MDKNGQLRSFGMALQCGHSQALYSSLASDVSGIISSARNREVSLVDNRNAFKIGNRKAFKQMVIAYLCIGGLLGLGIAFYGTSWGREINEVVALSILAIYGAASLIAVFLTWRRARKGKPIRPLYPYDLLPKKLRRWTVGESDTDSDH